MPLDRILPRTIDAFAKAIRAKFKDSGFAKRYLHALVDEVVVTGDTATIRGNTEKLAMAIQKEKEGHLNQVPSFMHQWRARADETGHWFEEIAIP